MDEWKSSNTRSKYIQKSNVHQVNMTKLTKLKANVFIRAMLVKQTNRKKQFSSNKQYQTENIPSKPSRAENTYQLNEPSEHCFSRTCDQANNVPDKFSQANSGRHGNKPNK